MPRLISPYSITLPFVLLLSIPLAYFAVLTTVLASCILLFRVSLVYIDLAIAVIPYYLQRLFSSTAATTRSSYVKSNASSSPPSPTKRRFRRRSNASNATITRATSSLSPPLRTSIGPVRDFEGVGGWRIDQPDEDDEMWTKINSRLELPATPGRRHHQRSLTSGSFPGERRNGDGTHSPELTMGGGVTPNSKRARTPTGGMGISVGTEGYFGMMSSGIESPRLMRKSGSAVTLTGQSISPVSSRSSGLSLKHRGLKIDVNA